jgi:hypothetical protein
MTGDDESVLVEALRAQLLSLHQARVAEREDLTAKQ